MLLDPRVRVVDELYVGEGEVSDLAVELALPLAVDAHLGDLDDVADVEPERGLVVGVRYAGLLHARVRGQLALERENEDADFENKSTYFAWFFWFCQPRNPENEQRKKFLFLLVAITALLHTTEGLILLEPQKKRNHLLLLRLS